MKQYFVYLLASENNQALYTGFTGDLEKRLYEHRADITGGFTKKYNCKKLVHFEVFKDPENGILREKEIKGWVRKRKDELIEKNNPDWNNLDPSAQALQDDIDGTTLQDDKGKSFDRYQRQLALPEITLPQQKRLSEAHIVMVGAGGLGCAALPYLASAGVGKITIIDNDTVSMSNLHRQTLYKDAQAGESKATIAASYAQELNPDIEVVALNERFSGELPACDLILDGSDNFETKTALNTTSIEMQVPLISASVNQWQGQIGLFAGFAKEAPCYHCLFPELPSDARNCNEAGILGTSAGLAGMYQAHMALCFLLGLDNVQPGQVLTFDFKTFRVQNLTLKKDPDCSHCSQGQAEWKPYKAEGKMAELISMQELAKTEHIIVDVRTADEIAVDPIEGAMHMEVSTVPARYEELPRDTLLAFVCAGNIRSVQAAEYLEAMGFNNICVLDKFSL